MTRTLLIDGDTLAFRAASVCDHTLENEFGVIQKFAIRPEGEAVLDNMILRLQDLLKGDKVVIFLSCPSEENWRLKVDPNYKSNRKGSVRPLLLGPLKNYLRQTYDAFHLAYLEADDALGIYATSEELCPGEKIVVGRDKDFHTIPGLHHQLDDLEEGKLAIRTVNALEAEKNHMIQTLAGDAVDGYPGCPGVGMKRAKEILEDPRRLTPKEGVITRGKNKGQKTVKWFESEKPSGMWETIVSHYEKAGLGVEEALQTARIAKILLADDYDIETHTVKLFVPREGM
jgi:DNA polymerase-1